MSEIQSATVGRSPRTSVHPPVSPSGHAPIRPPVLSPTGREALAACVALVGAESDPWARTWRDATRLERKMLLRISGLPEGLADTHSRWAALTDHQRLTIKQRAKDMHAWLGRRLADAARRDAPQSGN